MSPVVVLPRAAEPLLSRFCIAFTPRTFQRVVLLFVGSVLALGRHTVTRALWSARTLAAGSGHFTDYHRVFSRARWSLWPLGKVLAAMVLELVPEGEPAVCPVDDTTPQHKGKCVYGKGRHRDNCRSTRSHTVWVFGHKWVVLAVNVRFYFSSRPWALPVLAALYRPKELDEREGRRHKTTLDLARQLMAVLVHWFPRRKFILLGDGGYASHELARFCHRHRRHVMLVSRLHPRANLYAPPPPRRKGRSGRPRVKGAKLPAPEDVVAASARKCSTVGWYGGKSRRVEFVTGTGHWYKGGGGLVPVRWVFVHDLEGTHEDGYFYCTDPRLSPSRIVTLYTGRWSIEVTFQEARQHLGFHTPRSWTRASVLRTAPCLLGCWSLVCLIYHRHTRGEGARPLSTAWYEKAEPTFADVAATVRRLLWSQTVLEQADRHRAFQKLPPALRETLLDQLTRAA
jgi:DDE superfamily endonuclease